MSAIETPRLQASPAHAVRVEQLIAILGSDRERGLDDAGAHKARARHGYNELDKDPPVPLWKKFLTQFNALVIWILIAAAIISGLLGEWPDALAILAIVLLNSLLGFFQEEKAEKALAALQKLSAPQAKVIRNGTMQILPARELVPGDRVELEAGDNIPADVRLVEVSGLRVQEAALTGESLPEEKDARCVLAEGTPLAERRNMAYLGTVVSAGKASAVVVSTGMKTELGRIAGMLQRQEPEPTPLQKRLTQLGRVLAIACLAIVAMVFVLELLKGGDVLDVFLLSVSLAVAAVPEGLPAVVTIALALGLQRMVCRHVLIRRLPSVETLGSVTVICSDKTGTLTCNEMTVREIYAGAGSYEVSGVGYTPRGGFMKKIGTELFPVEPSPSTEQDLFQSLNIAVYCNSARIRAGGIASEDWEIIGDPTEGALLVAGLKAGIQPTNHEHQVIYEIPFDSERKAMSVVLREPGKKVLMYTKGAPEVILSKCTSQLRDGRIEALSQARRQQILEVGAAMASRALRVLAVAYRECPESRGVTEEVNLVFAGLLGMIDPPREEVKDAVRTCHEAGIRPIMITGDHPATALAIARELGIVRDLDRVVTGAELDTLTDEQLVEAVEKLSVYARVAPEHKLRIVKAWQSKGHIVAMTGDGVNDAPAIKAADIGIAMGRTGTDVTKEASAMVLMDDNFASIVNAIEEGRGIYDNIQKFVQYLLAGNTGLILFVFFAHLVKWPFPLITIQILWINLVTNGLPALALGLEPPEPNLMRRKPRSFHEAVITLKQSLMILFHGSLVAGATAIAFAIVYQGDQANLPRARTMAFCVIAFSFIFYSLTCRSQRYTIAELGFFTNPMLLGAVAVSCLLQLSVVMLPFAQPVFETVTHFGWEWAVLIVLAILPFTVLEMLKLIRSRVFRPRGEA